MRTWGIHKVILIAAVVGVTACAGEEPLVDKRQAKLAALDAIPNEGQAPAQAPQAPAPQAPAPVVVIPEVIKEVTLAPPTFAAATALKDIKPADVVLVSKVSEAETMIYLKGGKSFSYKPDAAVATDKLKPIAGVAKVKDDQVLYTLGNSQFWYVGPDTINVRAPGGDGTTFQTINFTPSEFKVGNVAKMKVLYVNAATMILQFDTHIVIIPATFDLETNTSTTKPRYFEIAKLPFKMTGNILAGRKAEGYWFKSDEGIYFLAEKEVAGTSPWSKSALTLAPAGITSLGIWPNADSAKTLGISVAVTAAGLLSDVPAAAAAPAAPTTP